MIDKKEIEEKAKEFEIHLSNVERDYVFTGPGGNGYSNSNNFAYELGSRAGVSDQVSSFDPLGWTPGNGKGLAAPNQPSKSEQVVNKVKDTFSKIKNFF